MHGTSIDSVEDMASLGDLHEGAIMYNIKQRYTNDLMYTYIGSIVAALNPYKTIPGIYDDEVRQPLTFSLLPPAPTQKPPVRLAILGFCQRLRKPRSLPATFRKHCSGTLTVVSILFVRTFRKTKFLVDERQRRRNNVETAARLRAAPS